jgi:hypothetical protein
VSVLSIAPSSAPKEDSPPKEVVPEPSKNITAPSSRLLGGVKKRKVPAKQEKDEENSRASAAVLAILGKKDD